MARWLGSGKRDARPRGPEARLAKLAERIQTLAEKDERMLRNAHDMGEMRRRAAAELHGVCASFVGTLNRLMVRPELELDPPAYDSQGFDEDHANLFQINVRGRILQIEFEATPELVSTEDFRIPYTLAGSIRCFNQELLEHDMLEEHLLFYCLEKSGKQWRFFDARTYRSGPVDRDYLASLLERLV